MPSTPDAGEARRIERIRLLMEKERAVDQETAQVEALIGGTFEASVVDLAAPSERATLLAVDAGMVLLRYADQEQSRYWVPLARIRWLKIVS